MEKLKKSFQRIARLSLSFLLLLGSLTSCGALPSNRTVEAGIHQMFPDAVLLDVQTGKRSEDSKCKTFTLENKGVQFTYEIHQARDFFFNTKITHSKNNYCNALFAYFSKEIDEISRTYQVKVEVVSNSYVQIRKDVTDDVAELDDGIDAMQAIYTLLQDYLPKTELSWFPFQFSLFLQYGEKQQFFIQKQGDWDEAASRQLLYLNFKANVEAGLVSQVRYSQEWLDSIPQKYIRSLYINGALYQSQDYEICFLYNVDDGRYYTRVGFGVKIDYNGGVEDYLQREIIEAYYPDCGYSISQQEKTSSYTIGADHYLIRRKGDSWMFLKNGEDLHIPYQAIISGTHTGAAYYVWVPADNFAALLGMSLEKVEKDGVYLRFS